MSEAPSQSSLGAGTGPRLLLLNVAALSPWELDESCPTLSGLAARGSMRPLVAPPPALTCSSHATMLTGLDPQEHGAIANGWYEATHGKVFNWGRSDRLISGEKLWEAARRVRPELKSANLFWRYCTHSTCDITLTERPTYFADGRKGADVYCSDQGFKERLISELGPFPFFHFWGPKAQLASTQWIVDSARKLLREETPELLLCYAPGLDYEGQRFGPHSPEARETLRAADAVFKPLIEEAIAMGWEIAIVSDYGFTEVNRPVALNLTLRRAGFLAVDRAVNGELLEPGASRAFAVCDNQAAHVYVSDPQDVEKVAALLMETEGVRTVYREGEQPCLGHSRAGQLLAVAEPNAWFTYRYWLDEEAAPDFSRCVDIFNKPGFDPCELFLRGGLSGGIHMARRFAQLKLGIRAPFDVIDAKPERLRGARNILPERPEDGAVLITSWPQEEQAPLPMRGLKELLLRRLTATPGAT